MNKILKISFNNVPLEISGKMNFDNLAKSRNNHFPEIYLIHYIILRHRQFVLERHFNDYGTHLPEYCLLYLLTLLPKMFQTLKNHNQLRNTFKIVTFPSIYIVYKLTLFHLYPISTHNMHYNPCNTIN